MGREGGAARFHRLGDKNPTDSVEPPAAVFASGEATHGSDLAAVVPSKRPVETQGRFWKDAQYMWPRARCAVRHLGQLACARQGAQTVCLSHELTFHICPVSAVQCGLAFVVLNVLLCLAKQHFFHNACKPPLCCKVESRVPIVVDLRQQHKALASTSEDLVQRQAPVRHGATAPVLPRARVAEVNSQY